MMLIRSRTLSVKHNHCCAAVMTGSALNRLWNLRTLALDMAHDAAITRIRKTPAKDSTSSSSTRTSNGRSSVSIGCSGGRTFRYDTRCYFNVRSKADMNRLNLPHGKSTARRRMAAPHPHKGFVCVSDQLLLYIRCNTILLHVMSLAIICFTG